VVGRPACAGPRDRRRSGRRRDAQEQQGRALHVPLRPDFFRAETADTPEEADRWYEDKRNNRRTPDLLPRDEVARAINAEVKAGRGSPHGGVFLDIGVSALV